MKYRADIQVLRGLAVFLVVAFHLEFFLLPAGFLGVDIFFAISGYLMAGLFDPADVKSFYLRRAKRLLPAYFAVVVLTGVVGLFVVTPNSYGQLSPQLFFASVFSSNIGFWFDDSYFEKLSFRPLLHLWSLGVEIQFYLVLPWLAWVFRRLKHAFWGVVLLSLLLCFFMVTKSPKTAFLWLPFRAWEFLLGYACFAWYGRWQARQLSAPGLGVLCLLGMVGLACLPVDGVMPSVLWGHPGAAALVAVLLTATLLVVGLSDKVLTSWPMVALRKLGDYSYSIYLVHFPLITFLLYEPTANLTPSTADGLLLVGTLVAMVGCAFACHRWVERGALGWGMRQWVLGAWTVVAGLLVLGPWLQERWIPAAQLPVYQARLDADVFRCGRWWRVLNPLETSCLITPSGATEASPVLLLGNSHADSIKRTFAEVAHRHGLAVWFMVGNRPMMGGDPVGPGAVMQEVTRRGAKTVYVHYSPEEVPLENLKALVNSATSAGVRVVWLAPVPIWKEHVPMMIWRGLNGMGSIDRQTASDYLDANRALFEQVRAIQSPLFEVVSVHEQMCRPECLLMDAQHHPFYRDANHLSLTGSRLLAPLFERMLAAKTPGA